MSPWSSRPVPKLLLAAASAGLLAQGAAAAVYDDVNNDLSNSHISPTPLSYPAITGVNGHLDTTGGPTPIDHNDYLNLQNLLAGSTLTVDATWTPGTALHSIDFSFQDSAGNDLPSVTGIVGNTGGPFSDSRSMTVPADGVVGIWVSNSLSDGDWSYTLTFTGTAVPEPATTAAGAAATLAALLQLRRRRRTE